MGLSIHYSGYIIHQQMLDHMIAEVTDICETLGWFTHCYDDEIKGISFTAKGSEPVFMTFNRDGRILSPVNILVKDIYDGVQLDKELIFSTSTKTQYAGPDEHVAILKLLKYLSAKYLKNFILSDEGYYWETGDEKILSEQFEKYNSAMGTFCDILKDLPVVAGETAESSCDRLEKILRERFKGIGEND